MQNNQLQNIKILISTGELSGDLHAANIVRALKHRVANSSTKLELHAMGSRHLKEQGVTIVVDADRCAAINGFNLFKILTVGLWALLCMAWQLYRFRPDLLILVDYPDFNLRLARIAKLFNIKVLYYIPPKVWAWRTSRIKTIKKLVDCCAVIFPFEQEFFQKHGFDRSTYVGHPFSDTFKTIEQHNRIDEIKQLGLDPSHPVVAVFIGSRQSEVERHGKLAFSALDQLRQELPNTQALFAVATSVDLSRFNNDFDQRPWAKYVVGDSTKVMQLSDVGLLKSGTCNLEAAYCRLPFACFYVASRLAEFIVRYAVKLKEYSLVNIIKPHSVPEFIQDNASPAALAAELKKLLTDNKYYLKQQQRLDLVLSKLGYNNEDISPNRPSAADKVADLALKTATKTKRSLEVFRRVLRYLNPYRWQFTAALTCMVIFGVTDGAVPFLVKYILDDVFAEHDRSMLFILPLFLLGFTIIRAAADFGQQFLSARIGHNIVHDIRNRMHAHIVSLTPDFFIRNSVGTLLSRFTSDSVLVSALLTNSLASVIRDSIRIVALLATAFYLDPILALIAFVFMPIGIFPIYRFGRRMRSLSRKGQEAIGSISGLVQEVILGNRVVKIFGRESYEVSRFAAENQRLNQTFIKSERVRAMTGPVNELLGALAITGVLLYGGFSVIEQGRTQGEFIGFLLSVFLLYDPFKKLTRVNSAIQQGASGAERIFELLDQQPTVHEPINPIHLNSTNSVDFDHVYFSYEIEQDSYNGSPSHKWVLEDIKLHVPEGQTLAIVGYSGSGKTTLVDLIPRFIDPKKGSIKIGGIDIRQVNTAELRSRITMVSQHTFLFNDSVYNNIAYGIHGATTEQIVEAAQAAHAHEFIMQLPDGYDTILGQDGYSLSGGERQRISIARALLKDSPILIMDEATAALDNRSEHEVQQALDRLQQNRTTIVIAHRLSTIRNANCIIVLDQGKIIEAGTHQELLDQGGLFAKLYQLQFAGQDQEQAICN